MPISVFLDSSVILAGYNEKDPLHANGRNLIVELVAGKWGRIFISDYVFDECVTVALSKVGLREAVSLGQMLLNSQLSMLKVAEAVFTRAWEIFQRRNPGHLSFTDCTTVAFLEILGIEHLATFDKEFRKVKGVSVISA